MRDVNGIFEMNQLIISVKCHLSEVNLDENLLQDMLVFLSRVEKDLFSDEMNDFTQNNLSGDEWKALRNLADDSSIVIQGADKGSSVVTWDRDDSLQEASKRLWDTNIYEDVK